MNLSTNIVLLLTGATQLFDDPGQLQFVVLPLQLELFDLLLERLSDVITLELQAVFFLLEMRNLFLEIG